MFKYNIGDIVKYLDTPADEYAQIDFQVTERKYIEKAGEGVLESYGIVSIDQGREVLGVEVKELIKRPIRENDEIFFIGKLNGKIIKSHGIVTDSDGSDSIIARNGDFTFSLNVNEVFRTEYDLNNWFLNLSVINHNKR